MEKSFCQRILQEVKVILLLMVCFVGTVEAQGQGIVRGTVNFGERYGKWGDKRS